MKPLEPESCWHIRIQSSDDDLFKVRAERFAFLNVWRTYLTRHLKTCAYVMIPGRFSIIVCAPSESLRAEELSSYLVKKLRTKLDGIFEPERITRICEGVSAEQLYTEKDCIYRTFDLHTLPQKYSVTTDYRTYPFSSYQTLSTGKPSVIDHKRVWDWFGGKLRFSIFHQAYYGWVKPETVAAAS